MNDGTVVIFDVSSLQPVEIYNFFRKPESVYQAIYLNHKHPASCFYQELCKFGWKKFEVGAKVHPGMLVKPCHEKLLRTAPRITYFYYFVYHLSKLEIEVQMFE